MASQKAYFLVDSNVHRFWNNTIKNRELLKTAVCLLVTSKEAITVAVNKIDPASQYVFMSFLTNVVCDELGPLLREARIPALIELFKQLIVDGIFGLCKKAPEIKFFISPPNLRLRPMWYEDLLPSITRTFVESLQGRPPNLFVLPQFSDNVFEPDGVHFQPLQGILHLQHLVDSADDLLKLQVLGPVERMEVVEDEAKLQSNLIVQLENRVNQLEKDAEFAMAKSSEEFDSGQNERDLDRFIITGLPKIAGASQDDLRVQVARYIANFKPSFQSADIAYVRVQRSRSTLYNVQCKDVATSMAVKTGFEAAVKSKPPPNYIGQVSISFVQSLGTRVRLLLLKLVSKRYMAVNPGSKCVTSAFTARPILRVQSKGSEGKTETRSYSFVEAMKGFGHLLDQEDRDKATYLAGPAYAGRLSRTFIILDDDRKLPPQSRKRPIDPDVAGAKAKEIRN